jgi:opacity protein-like surface antigen
MGRLKAAIIAATVVTAAGFAAGVASAQGFSSSDFYLKGFGGATWMQDQSGAVKSSGSKVGDGDASYDTGYTLGVALGYDFTPNFAFELEYAYRDADTTTDIGGTKYGGSTNSNAVMLNALYKFNPMGAAGAVQPYVGGGLGWANMESDIDTQGSFNRDNALAWQVIGGVGYAVNPNWTLLGEVRYFATDSGTLDGPGGLSWDAQMETVDVLFGAVYNF